MAVLAILGAMVIYGANFGVTRYGTLHGLTPADLTALRFGVAGPLMLPLFIRRGVASCAGIGWGRGIALAVTSGATMTFMMNTGLSLAPASHGAALGPGTVTAIGVVFAAVTARAWPPPSTLVGLAAVAAGLASIALSGTATGARNVVLGDLCFFATGLIWGSYPILIHRWRVPPTTSAAIVSVLSLLYIPVYLLTERSNLLSAPVGLVLFQAFFQGVLNVIVALWLWGHAVKTLGARTQIFPPLIPVLGTVLAVPILGEVPGPVQAGGLALIVGGIMTAVLGERIRRWRNGV